MRFLISENKNVTINIDKIESILVQAIDKPDNSINIPDRYVLLVNKIVFYIGDFVDVNLRYNNLMHVLLKMDTPSDEFVPNDSVVMIKTDGTIIVQNESLWDSSIKI